MGSQALYHVAQWSAGHDGRPRCPHTIIAKYLDNRCSFTLIELDPGKLILRQIDENGAELDSITVTKPN